MRKFAVILLMLAILAAPALAQEDDQTIADVLQNDARFTTLLSAVEDAERLEALNGDEDFTLFAPTDKAFDALPEETLQGILASPPSLEAVLNYHIAEGTITSEELDNLEALSTLLGAPIAIEITTDGVVLNGSIKVIESDILVSNGVIHVIDAVLLPERGGSSAAPTTAGNTIADVIMNTENLDFLITALDIVPPVSGYLAYEDADSLTLLAPNDNAFQELDDDTRRSTVENRNTLVSVLLYHTIEGVPPTTTEVMEEVAAADGELEVSTALPGASLIVTVEDGALLINGKAKLVQANLEASNGMVHIIDTVLIPPQEMMLSEEEAEELLADLSMEVGAEPAPESDLVGQGPELDENWDAVANGFGITLETAGDFFQTAIDPFAEGEEAELYGIEIINWTAQYQYTGYVVEQFLPAEVLLWMAEQDPSIWDNIAPEVVEKLPDDEVGQLPEEVQALAQ